MDTFKNQTPQTNLSGVSWEYCSGLTANLATGNYEFRDGMDGKIPRMLCMSINRNEATNASVAIGSTVTSVLSLFNGFDLSCGMLSMFAEDVAVLYQRLIR